MSGQVREMRQQRDRERGCGTQQIHANTPFRVFCSSTATTGGKKKKKKKNHAMTRLLESAVMSTRVGGHGSFSQ